MQNLRRTEPDLVFTMISEFHRHLQTAQGYLELGMVNDAVEALEDIEPELKTAPDVLAVRVGIYEFMQRWEEMAMMARLLVKALPGEVEWWLKLAIATRRSKSTQEAVEILLQAEMKHPKDAMIKYNLAGCYSQLGKLDEAKSRLGTAIGLDDELRRLALDDRDLAALFAAALP